MKLQYNTDTLLFHLRHIKKMCLENVDCTGCPFNLADKYSDMACRCMFSDPQLDDGTIPEDWDLEIIEKEGHDDAKTQPII